MSDISMRAMKVYPNRDTLDIASKYFATRIDWSYIKDTEFINEVKKRGLSFQGTLNAITNVEKYALLKDNGTPRRDHFGRAGRYWANPNDSEYRLKHASALAEWIHLGADSIQRDEPNAHGYWSENDTISFYSWLDGYIEGAAITPVPLSTNLGSHGASFAEKGEILGSFFSFGMTEIDARRLHPNWFWNAGLTAYKLNKIMVYTAGKRLTIDQYRKAIALSYANGSLFIVPWDQFGGKGNPRVFIEHHHLADLYGFIRSCADLIDDYEPLGFEASETHWKELRNNTGLKIKSKPEVSFFVRQKTKADKTSTVIHCISDSNTNYVDIVLNIRLNSDKEITAVNVYEANRYNEDTHVQAIANKSYSSLHKKRKIPLVIEAESTARLSFQMETTWAIIEFPTNLEMQ